MKSFVQITLIVIALVAAALLVDQITALTNFARYLDEHPEPYRSLAIVVSIVGWALLIIALAYGLWTQGTPMSEEEAQAFARTSTARPRMHRVFAGRAAGRTFYAEDTIRAIKDSVRTGAWRHDSPMWPFLIGLPGLALAVYGMFGYFFVVGPPLVKLICAGVLAYATVRAAWGFYKA